jgi:Ca2+-binding RTX toxin-like protein
MRGGQGNDTYVVDNSGDLVIEGALAGSGIDLVESSITYTLTQNVENLTLTGIDNNIDGYGNNLSNIITGTTGRNYLDGREGNDILFGKGSEDFLSGGAGFDYLLGGGANDGLDGGNESDSLDGGIGNDALVGRAGNDSLTGGADGDLFVFFSGRAFRRADMGVDTIINLLSTPPTPDFTSGIDQIELYKDTFTTLSSAEGVGFSDLSEFDIVNSDSAAEFRSADIVYNSRNGKLFYNPNGSISGFDTASVEGGHFVTLFGAPTLSRNDFVLVNFILG